MIEEIFPIPPSFEELRIAALTRQLVPFIGAGVSMLAGCPGWDAFADNSLRFYLKNEKLPPAEYDQIKPLPSRIKISLALELERKTGLSINFRELLAASDDKKEFGLKLYEKLGSLGSRFVTTNYDEFLDVGRTVFHQAKDISIQNFETQNSVFHIHGSLLDPHNMVRTTDEYLARYASHEIHKGADGENPFLTFLKLLFKTNTVLFIGYSLRELEVLEYVLQKSDLVISEHETELRHFILQGFFTHELPLARSLEKYFARFGVSLIPYSRDERDWDQLSEVIDALATYLPKGKPLALPKLREMEDLLS